MLTIGFAPSSGSATVHITGFLEGIPVTETTVSGTQNTVTTVTLKANKLSAVECSGAPARLLAFRYFAIKEGYTGFWEVMQGPHLFRLPIRHGAYPISNAAEDFGISSKTAHDAIKYGSVDVFFPPSSQAASTLTPVLTTQGTVTVTNGSAIVVGSGTNWTPTMVGETFQLTNAKTVYIIIAVINSQKLVLNRRYQSVSTSGLTYTIGHNTFAGIYTQLATMLEESAVGMTSVFLPKPEKSAGTVRVTAGLNEVEGSNTDWTTRLEGMTLEILLPTSGQVTVKQNSTVVVGSETNWNSSLVGGVLYIHNDTSPYQIKRVDSFCQLTLERPYTRPTKINQDYSISYGQTFTITQVQTPFALPQKLILNRAYNGSNLSGLQYLIYAPIKGSNADMGTITARRHYPLDLLMLASMHPAVAQMLGLYFIDTSAKGGSSLAIPSTHPSYDYLLIADYTGVYKAASDQGTTALLNQINNDTGQFPGVYASIVYDMQKVATPPLAAPANLVAYQLPDNAAGSAQHPMGNGSVGLRWELGLAARQVTLDNGTVSVQGGFLLPNRPVAYHVWRADLGATNPTTPPPISQYHLLTVNAQDANQVSPLLVSQTPTIPGVSPQRPPDWPQDPLLKLDNHLQDGWYSYAVSGIDIFGRHSPLSTPAQWQQWAPMPQPRPWYYQDPEGFTTIHNYAVHILDKIPPPPPTGVEAYILDPADPMLVRDNAYNQWYGQLAPPDKAKAGLRVRWCWLMPHMQQAPDTQEFRIYLHSDKQLPPGDHDSANWQQRYFVVNYGQYVTQTTDEQGRPMRVYDVLLPPVGASAPWPPLTPTLANPVVFAHIGVSAADNKTHTADKAKWNGTPWGGRTGNEGRLGPVARIFQVLRTPPPPPAVPPADGELIYATAADYHDRSYYTYRWTPIPHLKTHVLRAMDETLFLIDWNLSRQPGFTIAADRFPSEPRWDSAKKQQVTNELHQLVANLQGIAHTPAGQAQALGLYRALSNDALRVLAGLPGNEKAFVQLTIQPLDATQPETADHRGPDDPATYTPNAQVRAYQDTLDGRARNRYLYRAMYVDGANNRSALSLASAPVGLPDIMPPQAPVLTNAIGGDRQITLKWASNREPDLKEYRVYRTDIADHARDLRLMTLVGTVTESAAPAARAASINWTNTPVQGLITYTYCVTAVDTANNSSLPAKPVAARAFDEALPVAPRLSVAMSHPTTPLITFITWTATEETRLQRQDGDIGIWENATDWLPAGAHSLNNTIVVNQSGVFYYRLRVRKASGAVGVGQLVSYPPSKGTQR